MKTLFSFGAKISHLVYYTNWYIIPIRILYQLVYYTIRQENPILIYHKGAKMNDLISWEEFKNKKEYYVSGYIRTSIACPKCGNALCKNTNMFVATDPPQYYYTCFKCNWSGTA